MLNLKNGSTVSLFALTCALTSMSAAYADEDKRVEDTIIVTSLASTQAAEALVAKTPGGADIVSHEEYANRFLVSLRDTLAFSPGVYTQPRYGQEVRISIRGSGISRGFHMRGLTLLQDGAPINLADDNGDFQELEPIFFDHLEVYRGSNALRFGSGTLGGAINGVTPTGKTAQGVYLRADVGSFNTARGLISGGTSRDKLDAWGALSADTSDGDREHASRQSVRFHGNIGYAISNNITSRFYASINQIDQELPGALTEEIALTEPKTGNFFNDQARDIDSVRIQNQTLFNLGESELKVGLFYNDKSLFHPIFQVVNYDSIDQGIFTRWNWIGKKWEVSLGGEARFGDIESKRFVNNNGTSGDLTFDADQNAYTANIYGEVRFKPTNQLTLIGGGIYANGEREQHTKFNSFMGGPVDATGKADFDAFSPKLGVLYTVDNTIQLYANYSKSAEFPGFIELAQIASFVPIEEQTAWTLETGSRGSLGIAEWDISLYRSEIDNEILQFNIDPDTPASTFNANDTIHQGLEAGLSLQLSEWLKLRQIYQYSDFKFEDDSQYGDNTLPVIPEHVYRAELQVGSNRFNVAPSLEWIPEGPYADYTNTKQLDGYVLLGLTASIRVSDSIDFVIDARNLTDERAVGDVSATISADASSRIYTPIERRAVFGSIRARF
ncbi:TonB-dependent receptor family protein [Hirschia litorea]|uniref:TonB-dependent receptor family protein n=1 Tax=Hirschia litorea TaxID=1199156 RepID=A0ABW2IH91_9PROT